MMPFGDTTELESTPSIKVKAGYITHIVYVEYALYKWRMQNYCQYEIGSDEQFLEAFSPVLTSFVCQFCAQNTFRSPECEKAPRSGITLIFKITPPQSLCLSSNACCYGNCNVQNNQAPVLTQRAGRCQKTDASSNADLRKFTTNEYDTKGAGLTALCSSNVSTIPYFSSLAVEYYLNIADFLQKNTDVRESSKVPKVGLFQLWLQVYVRAICFNQKSLCLCC